MPVPTVFLRVHVSGAPRDVVPVLRWSPVAHPSADLVFGLLFRQRGRHRFLVSSVFEADSVSLEKSSGVLIYAGRFA